MGAPILALFWLGRWFSKIAAAARKPFRITAAQRRRASAAPETDSSLLILFCGYMWGRGESAFRRTKVTTIHTTGRSHRRIMVAGCSGSRGVRDPGGPSSITRPAKPRTHPGLENRETWGTPRYLISVPKTRMALGRRTWASRQRSSRFLSWSLKSREAALDAVCSQCPYR